MNNAFSFEMLNQALKGFAAGMGSGSGPTQHVRVVKLSEEIGIGGEILCSELIDAVDECQDGAYLIVASKVVSIALKRIVTVPKYPLPQRHAPYEMLKLLKHCDRTGMKISLRDAIGADLIEETETELVFALLPEDPNTEAAKLARKLLKKNGKLLDVIISDTSSGWAKGTELIGLPTLLATPIGCTAGCDIYYAQRLAAMAEVLRNREELTPFVIVDPPTVRSRTRTHCGEAREKGFLVGNDREVYLKDG